MIESSFFYNTPAGWCKLDQRNSALTSLEFVNDIPDVADYEETPLFKETIEQLDAYFSGKLKVFDLPLAPHGTDFQLKVWKELREIPFGQTVSYQELAERCGNQKAYRAVGQANNRNPIAIIIPCHRVIGKNGDLTGYAGGVDIKQFLLEHERRM